MIISVKRQSTEWVKVFTSYTSDKRLVNRIYKEFKKRNIKKIDNPVSKLSMELNKNFPKDEAHISEKNFQHL